MTGFNPCLAVRLVILSKASNLAPASRPPLSPRERGSRGEGRSLPIPRQRRVRNSVRPRANGASAFQKKRHQQ